MKIETSRLTLRPWDDEDVEQLVLGLNDLTVAKWLAFVPHPYLTSHAKDWVHRCREISGAGGRPVAYEFALELRHERRCMADGRQTIEHVTVLLRSDWKDCKG